MRSLYSWRVSWADPGRKREERRRAKGIRNIVQTNLVRYLLLGYFHKTTQTSVMMRGTSSVLWEHAKSVLKHRVLQYNVRSSLDVVLEDTTSKCRKEEVRGKWQELTTLHHG